MTSHPGLCFCCSHLPFAECCEPILKEHGNAQTPEALMRSRYTAYVTGNEGHLLATWSPETRPRSLDLENSRVKWLELVVHSGGVDQADENRGEVDFSARFIERDQVCELRENSRFVRVDGLWYYLEGKTETTKTKIGRNSPCPCGSGRKFKRCCLAGV